MNSLLKMIFPVSIKKKLYNYFLKLEKNKILNTEKKIPKQELNKKHISSLKPLLNREELLKNLPKNGIVAELGVDKGEFSKLIFDITSPSKLHLVDYWGDERYNQEIKKQVEEKFTKEISENKIEINLGLSTEVVQVFKDEYFDWIYIDTDHTYKGTKKELELYSKKIKPGGIIAGHDFIKGNWKSMFRYGVIEAVYEFCVKYDWEIIYLTLENGSHPSFAIRKINK
ncbi:MAG: class I SAM-dependent methyltransferase [Bacteroidales bacterium]|nr:class I SAM-dependent methyltransferase [Bacteroidales bacterium]